MKPFSLHHSCPKCGATPNSIAVRHVRRLGSDAIRRTCGRCEYVWDEEPLDRATEREAMSPTTSAE